jgi:predicted nucleotidyltransferase
LRKRDGINMILKALKSVARCLSEAGIPYMVIGGQAVLQYGLPRFTQDIDITIAMTPRETNEVLNSIEGSFRILPRDIEKFIQDTWVLPVEHLETGVRVDFIFSVTAFEREAIERAREINVEDMLIRYISPEDLIVQKIIAGRAIDLEDTKSILDIQGERIDMERIEKSVIAFSREMGEEEWLNRWQEVKACFNKPKES